MGLPMENDLLAATSEQIKEPELKFGTQKNLLSLTFQSKHFVFRSRDTSHDHFTKNLTIDKTGDGFKKRSHAVSFFHSH